MVDTEKYVDNLMLWWWRSGPEMHKSSKARNNDNATLYIDVSAPAPDSDEWKELKKKFDEQAEKVQDEIDILEEGGFISRDAADKFRQIANQDFSLARQSPITSGTGEFEPGNFVESAYANGFDPRDIHAFSDHYVSGQIPRPRDIGTIRELYYHAIGDPVRAEQARIAGEKMEEVLEAIFLRGAKGGPAIPRPRPRGTVTIKGKRKKVKECTSKGNCNTEGNPTAVVTGMQSEDDARFLVPGLIPIQLGSYFQADLGEDEAFGRNRISDIDATIKRSEGRLVYLDEAGFPVKFNQPTPNPNHWVEDDAVRPMKLSAGPKRSLILQDKREFKHFHKFPDGIWRIVLIRDPNGNQAVLHRHEQDGKLLSLVTPEGLEVSFSYNAEGLRTAVHLSTPSDEKIPVLRWEYDKRRNMTLSECVFGDKITFAYDDSNQRNHKVRNGGYEARYVFDKKDRVSRYQTNSYYHNASFVYDTENRNTAFIPDLNGALTKYYYDKDERVIGEANMIGAIKRTEFNDEGYVGKEIDGEGHETSYTYDADGNIKSVTDSEGRETFYYWDENRQLEILIDPEGNAWDYEYDEKGNLEAVQDPLGHRTEIKNNEAGLPLAVCRHDGHIQFNTYDDHHRLIETVDFGGAKTRFDRDAFGRITAITDPAGEVTRFTYSDQTGLDFWEPSEIVRSDGVKQVIKAAGDRKTTETLDGEGRKTVSEVDAFGNLTAMIDAGGGKLAFHYDKLEQLEKVENQQGLFWTFERDGAQRITRETDFSGQVTTYAYDYADRLIETRQNKVKRRYEWDKSGLLLKQNVFLPGQAEPEVTSYWYDDRGLLAGAENAAAKVEFERDAAGQIIAEIAGGVRIESEYDCCGRRILRRLDGSETTYSYFPTDGLKELTIAGHAPLTFTRDARGLELGRSSAAGFHLEQSFDALGQLATQKAGPRAPVGEPSAPTGKKGVSLTAGAPGQAAGAPGVERSFGWNRAFEPTKITDKRWGGLGYGYDKNGQIIETRFGDGAAEKFAYDKALNVAATAHAPATSQSDGASTEGTTKQQPVYTMKIRPSEGHRKGPDAADFRSWQSAKGGRITEARGANGETIRLKFDEHSRVTMRRVTRKGFREQVWRYGWDGEDRLVECLAPGGERHTYAYDPFGRRTEKQAWTSAANRQSAADPEFEPGQKTHYLWDGDVLARESVLDKDGEPLCTADWHFEPESFVPLAKEEGDRLWYVVTDHLGTPRELLSEDGALVWAAEFSTWGGVRRLWQADNDNEDPTRGPLQGYDTQGKPVYTTILRSEGNLALKPLENPDPNFCPIRFQGQWADEETGLYYNRFRYYDPLSAQYMSPDPIGILGGFNSQAYVHNPGSWIDPLGLAKEPCCGDKKRNENKIGNRRKYDSKKEAREAAQRAGKGKKPIKHAQGKHGPHYHPDVKMPPSGQQTPNMPTPHDHYYYPKGK